VRPIWGDQSDGRQLVSTRSPARAQVDEGTYTILDHRTLLLSRPPLEIEVRYRIDDDMATFDLLIPPACESHQCLQAAALGIGTFFPRTYRRTT
jgi:hypothetical protein